MMTVHMTSSHIIFLTKRNVANIFNKCSYSNLHKSLQWTEKIITVKICENAIVIECV